MAEVTQTQIANKAFILLGSANRIASFSDSSPLAAQVADLWDVNVRDILAEHPWKFALARAEVQRDADWTPATAEALYRYTLPSDCLRWLPPDAGDADFFEAQEEGGKLISDSEGPVVIRYIADVRDISRWHANFVNALAYRLAYELSESVSASQSQRDRMQVGEEKEIKKAKRNNALASGRRDRGSLFDRSRWLRSRNRGEDWQDHYRFGGA